MTFNRSTILTLLSVTSRYPFSQSLADENKLCLAECNVDDLGTKRCTFHFEVDIHASELGYFKVKGCDGIMPTLGMEKGVAYIFDQSDSSNYYHPLGFAYYSDGAHVGEDELEPVVRILPKMCFFLIDLHTGILMDLHDKDYATWI